MKRRSAAARTLNGYLLNGLNLVDAHSAALGLGHRFTRNVCEKRQQQTAVAEILIHVIDEARACLAQLEKSTVRRGREEGEGEGRDGRATADGRTHGGCG